MTETHRSGAAPGDAPGDPGPDPPGGRGGRSPRIEVVGHPPERVTGLVLVLHGGRSTGSGGAHRLRLALLRMLPFARPLAAEGRAHGVAVWLVRYRHRGWNGAARDAARDAAWACAEAARRHPGVPVVLLGHSMGGRAALHAAGHPAVRAVCALAPWLDGTDPVTPVAGRTVLIAHGDRDRMTDPFESHAYAVRATEVTDRVGRFEMRGDGHAMLRRAGDWTALVRRFVAGELGVEPEDPVIANALRRADPEGLRAAWPGLAGRPSRGSD